eukprot:11293651-Ditylum_brightwellii.AAC.1
MKYPSEAIGTISASIRCIDATSKKLLIVYLPQVEVTIDEDGDTDEEWITGTTLDSAGRLLLVKVLASQFFYSFDELARTFDNFPAHLMGDVIEDIPETDSVNPPFGDNNLHIVSLPPVISVSYKHVLTSGALSSHQLEQMENYHLIMGLWGNTIQYQFSLQSGMSTLTLRANNVPDNHSFKLQASGAVDIVQLHKDDNDDKPFIQGIRH